MGLANFFDKAVLGASQILHGFDREKFQQKLSEHNVAITFNDAAARSHEGRVGLELTTDMLARLYPRVALVAPESCKDIVEALSAQARAINPDIEIGTDLMSATVCISLGVPVESIPTIYSGSNGWVARLSDRNPVEVGASAVPFGACAAACFTVANVFRITFADELSGAALDSEIEFSLLDLTGGQQSSLGLDVESIGLGEVCWVGLGAVGTAAIWCLSRASNLSGTFHFIDPQILSLSNLQRYVGCVQEHLQSESAKVSIASKNLTQIAPHITVHEHMVNWAEYLRERNNWNIPKVAVSVDTPEARCEVQGSLPRMLFNAWTGLNGDVGVSRHNEFGSKACLMCLYIPTSATKSQDQVVLEALGLPQNQQTLLTVRRLLSTGEGLSSDALRVIAEANRIPLSDIAQFEGKPLHVFYSEAVCGGLLIRLAGQPNDIEVPMVFQSAMAGVLLAAEVVASAAGFRRSVATTTRLSLLRPIPEITSFDITRQNSGRCICEDIDFLEAFQSKHSPVMA